jgi:hypothetical protein
VTACDISQRLLLWGVEMPVPADFVSRIERRLETISRELGESSNRRTEPDAIVELGDAGLIVVEAKLRSANDRLSEDHAHWQRYVDKGFANETAVRETGLYELTRNWRFEHELAAGRPFTLVNLGSSTLFEDPRLEKWFQALDHSVQGRFVRMSWQHLLHGLSLESWMSEFCRQRGL